MSNQQSTEWDFSTAAPRVYYGHSIAFHHESFLETSALSVLATVQDESATRPGINSMAVWFNVTRVPSDKVRILAYLKSNWNNIGSVSPEWKYNGQNAIGTFPSSIEVLARLAADFGLDVFA